MGAGAGAWQVDGFGPRLQVVSVPPERGSGVRQSRSITANPEPSTSRGIANEAEPGAAIPSDHR